MTELGTETWTTLSVKYNISSAVPYYWLPLSSCRTVNHDY
jgi:hypothetical protein